MSYEGSTRLILARDGYFAWWSMNVAVKIVWRQAQRSCDVSYSRDPFRGDARWPLQ
jgi:hypothetical protein